MFQIDTIYNVHQINSSWTKTIRVINKNITFKLDSGCDVKIIPWEHFKEIKPQPQMRSNKFKVESYGGHKIESLGKCQIKS